MSTVVNKPILSNVFANVLTKKHIHSDRQHQQPSVPVEPVRGGETGRQPHRSHGTGHTGGGERTEEPTTHLLQGQGSCSRVRASGPCCRLLFSEK